MLLQPVYDDKGRNICGEKQCDDGHDAGALSWFVHTTLQL
jgi:hypothetical protein